MVRREYREPALAASARQRVRELSSYHWETLKLMFVGQRHPGCVFAQRVDNDALRIMAGAVADALLSTESQAARDYEYAPWRGLLQQLTLMSDVRANR